MAPQESTRGVKHKGIVMAQKLIPARTNATSLYWILYLAFIRHRGRSPDKLARNYFDTWRLSGAEHPDWVFLINNIDSLTVNPANHPWGERINKTSAEITSYLRQIVASYYTMRNSYDDH